MRMFFSTSFSAYAPRTQECPSAVRDPLVARVVARYLAWADGKLVDVDEDDDEFPRFNEDGDHGTIFEPAGVVGGSGFDPRKSPREKS